MEVVVTMMQGGRLGSLGRWGWWKIGSGNACFITSLYRNPR